jgi:hypothetical protein
MRKKYFVFRQLAQPRQDKNLLYRHDDLDEPIKEGPLSFVLFESPFASVSTVSRSYLLSSLCDRVTSLIRRGVPRILWYKPAVQAEVFYPSEAKFLAILCTCI